jgi:hypothetical protein
MSSQNVAAWCIIALATLGVIVRPFRLPEAIWAVAGATALVLFGLLPWSDAVQGLRKGIDVYLFLIGMMMAQSVGDRFACHHSVARRLAARRNRCRLLAFPRAGTCCHAAGLDRSAVHDPAISLCGRSARRNSRISVGPHRPFGGSAFGGRGGEAIKPLLMRLYCFAGYDERSLQYTSPVPGGFSSAAASERYSSLPVPASAAIRLR